MPCAVFALIDHFVDTNIFVYPHGLAKAITRDTKLAQSRNLIHAKDRIVPVFLARTHFDDVLAL
jgi:hypothetical protein